METSVKFSKVADVKLPNRLKPKERGKKDNTIFPLVRFVSQTA